MERLKRLKQITLEDGIFFALVVFALGSCISGHLGKNSEMVAIALCVIRLLRGNIPMERLRVVKQLALVLGIFFGTMMISALQTGNFSAAVKFCPVLDWGFEVLLVFCVLLCVRSEKQIHILWGALFLSLLVVDGYMLYALSQGVHRPPGLLKGHLETSALYAVLIPALAVFAADVNISKRVKLVCWTMLAFALVGAYVIGTRGIWLAIPPVLVMALVYSGGGWIRSLRFVVACVLCVMAVVSLAPANIRNRVSPSALHGSSVTARLALYEGATKMFLDHPLLGVGTANFTKYWIEQYCPQDKPQWKNLKHLHSVYFQYLVEGGVVGFAGFAAMFGYILCWSWRRRHIRQGIILLGATLSLLLYGLSDNSLGAHEAVRVYWLMIGMAFSEEAVSLAEQQTG